MPALGSKRSQVPWAHLHLSHRHKKMLNSNILRQKLTAIDGQDYAGYQSLLGTYDFGLFRLIIQQIPKDPYAPPHTGIYRIQVQRSDKRIIRLKIESKIQKIACADFLARHFFDASQANFQRYSRNRVSAG